MMLVTTVAPGPRSEGCSSCWCPKRDSGRELIAKGVQVVSDMLILDKRTLVPLSLEELCSCSQGENCSLSFGFGGEM